MEARELHGLAAGQRWLLKQAQILEHLTEPQLRYAVHTGEIIPMGRGVYRPWGAPEFWEQRVQAVCWSTGAVASHRTAARLRGIEGVPSVRIEVTVGTDRRIRLPGVVAHRSNVLLPEFVTEFEGISVTTPDRTCLDLSAVCSIDVLEKAWASAEMQGLVTAESLLRTAIKMRARGRRRLATVDQLLTSWVPGYDKTESELQAKVLGWILADMIEAPGIEMWVVVNGIRFRLDLAWPQYKICIETDGWSSHRVRPRFDGDRAKVIELELAGWLVLPVTSRHTRQQVIDWVKRSLAARSSTTFGH